MPAMSPNAAFAVANKDGAATIVVTDRDGRPNMYTVDEAANLEKAIHDARQEGERLVSAIGIGVKSLNDRVPEVAASEDRAKQIQEANAKADAEAKKKDDEQRKQEEQRRAAVEGESETEEHKTRRSAHR